MNWPYVALFVLAGLGAAGVCLILAAFVLVARHGGWKIAMQQWLVIALRGVHT